MQRVLRDKVILWENYPRRGGKIDYDKLEWKYFIVP